MGISAGAARSCGDAELDRGALTRACCRRVCCRLPRVICHDATVRSTSSGGPDQPGCPAQNGRSDPRGRSVLSRRSVLPGLVAASFALAAAAAFGAGGPVGVLLVLLVLVLVLGVGWPTLLGLPTRGGSTTILALGSAAAVVVVALTADGGDIERGVRPDVGDLRWLSPVLAVTVILAFTHQLLRRDLRPRLVESVTGVVSGAVVGVLAAGWMAVAIAAEATTLIAVTVAPLVCAAIAVTIRWRHPVYVAAVVSAAAAAAAVVSHQSAELAWGLGAVIGGVVGVIVMSLDRLLAWMPSAASREAQLALGASYVGACGTVAHLIAQLAA